MKWNLHIEHIVKKISPYVFLLRRLRKFLNSNSLFTIYSAYIMSNVIYVNSIWNKAEQKYLDKIDILVKKAIKLIHNYPV